MCFKASGGVSNEFNILSDIVILFYIFCIKINSIKNLQCYLLICLICRVCENSDH